MPHGAFEQDCNASGINIILRSVTSWPGNSNKTLHNIMLYSPPHIINSYSSISYFSCFLAFLNLGIHSTSGQASVKFRRPMSTVKYEGQRNTRNVQFWVLFQLLGFTCTSTPQKQKHLKGGRVDLQGKKNKSLGLALSMNTNFIFLPINSKDCMLRASLAMGGVLLQRLSHYKEIHDLKI